MNIQDKAEQITLDRRDLFDAVRSAIKYAILDQGSRVDDAELYEDATNRTNECLSELYNSPEAFKFAVGRVVQCVAIPVRHEGYFTIGNMYAINDTDPSDLGYELNVVCDNGFALWCESEAFELAGDILAERAK